MFCENDVIKFIDCTLACLYLGMDFVREDAIYNFQTNQNQSLKYMKQNITQNQNFFVNDNLLNKNELYPLKVPFTKEIMQMR